MNILTKRVNRQTGQLPSLGTPWKASVQRQHESELFVLECERAYGATGNQIALARSAERNTDWVALT
jgi:hypothetical protein